jgi:hypothetical protein
MADIGNTLFDEIEAEDEKYNPALSYEQLVTPTHDAKLETYGSGVLVMIEVAVKPSKDEPEHVYTAVRICRATDLDSMVFDQGPSFRTRLLSTKPLTVGVEKALREMLAL